MTPIVILGSGLAGYGLAREIRKRDAAAPITVITADDGAAYAKPNLSNALAAGKDATRLASQSAEQVAAALHLRLLPHTRVTRIDPQNRRVETDRGVEPYRQLALALGADPFPHGLDGDAAAEVHTVNDLADYARFRAALAGRRRVAVIGGGLIGCEFANDLAGAGYQVEVVHLGSWPLERLVPEQIGRHLAAGLAALGVRWRFGVSAQGVRQGAQGIQLTLSDGSVIEADVALSAIGLRPRTALAAAAGLAVNRGIVTDAGLATSDPHIHALGDCAEVQGQVLPYVQPLLIQARALAATLTGAPTPALYPVMPVMVKTPACPLAVCPPPPGANGSWQVREEADGLEASFTDAAGRLLGFALTQGRTGLRTRMAQAVAGV